MGRPDEDRSSGRRQSRRGLPWTLLSFFLILETSPAHAGVDCIDEIAAASQVYGVPPALLYVVALTESGVVRAARTTPNAYAVNIEGKAYQFATQEAAIATVRSALAAGHQSVDVGCLQVNLHHHPQAFASLADAFDPKHNVDYGTQYLRDLYRHYGNWTSAVAYYHGSNPAEQWNYVCAVHTRLAQFGLAHAGDCKSLRTTLGTNSFRPALPPGAHQ